MEINFKDKFLNEEHKIVYIFEAMSYHLKLQKLTMSNCGLSDDSVEILISKLASFHNNIWHIDLS